MEIVDCSEIKAASVPPKSVFTQSDARDCRPLPKYLGRFCVRTFRDQLMPGARIIVLTLPIRRGSGRPGAGWIHAVLPLPSYSLRRRPDGSPPRAKVIAQLDVGGRRKAKPKETGKIRQKAPRLRGRRMTGKLN